MARRKNSVLGAILIGPGLIVGATLALWQNEGRFDYYRAARESRVILSPGEAVPEEAVAFTGDLDTGIPIQGELVTPFLSYHVVERRAEIYSWHERTDDDGNSTWSQGWYSSVEANSRNSGLSQRLSSTTIYPPTYRLGPMEVAPERIHIVDAEVSIPLDGVGLSASGASLGLEKTSRYLYLRQTSSDETVGDERASYTGVPNAPTATYFGVITDGRAVGRQFEENEGIIASIIKNDGILHHLVNGGREEALATVKGDFARTMWYTRLGGTVAMVLGFWVVFGTFASLLHRIPIIGFIAEIGALLVALGLGIPLALVVILTSLFTHNPFSVLLPTLLVVWGAFYLLRRSSEVKANAQAEQARLLAMRREREGGAPMPPGAGVDPALERTLSSLAAMALAEGELHASEVRFLTEWAGRHGIPGDRMNQILAEAQSGHGSADAHGREDLELLVCMALADGVLSAREWAVLEGLAWKIGVATEELHQILYRVGTTWTVAE